MGVHAYKFLLLTLVPVWIVAKRALHTIVIFALIYVITAVIFQFRTFVKINFGCIKTSLYSIVIITFKVYGSLNDTVNYCLKASCSVDLY